MNQINNEMSVYIDDILKNKEMIKEMFRTNIMVYEDKLKQNKEKSDSIRDELQKITSDFQLIENRLKLEYAKNHDEFQKHEINCKLLDKTLTHYKMLIREREDEIKKLEEQSIYAHQDFQNKKVKHDCLGVQIVEAEFQLKNLQNQMDEKLNQIIKEENYKHINSSETNKSKFEKSASTSNQMPNLDISEITRIDNPSFRSVSNPTSVNKFLKEKMQYRSTYADQSLLLEQISMNQDVRKKNCIIF